MATETFTAAGNWTVPAGVYAVRVKLQAPGGAGASRTTTGRGGGGGGGAYSEDTVACVPGASVAYSPGAIGTPGVNATNATWASTLVVAEGGKSVATNSTSGVSGGLADNGTGAIKFNGGNGGNENGSNKSGGGGGGAGDTGDGGNASGGTKGTGTADGGGDGGEGQTITNTNGIAGSTYGGGGSGGYRIGTNTLGGNGAGGRVVIEYFPQRPPFPISARQAVKRASRY